MAIAKINFQLNGKYYFTGDEVQGNYDQIAKLNEKGYIEPLTLKELQEYKNLNKEVN